MSSERIECETCGTPLLPSERELSGLCGSCESKRLRQQLAAANARLGNVRTKLNEATERYAAGREMFEVMFLVNCCIEDIEKTIFPQPE